MPRDVDLREVFDAPSDRRIAGWKFATGIMIHVSIPAYLLTMVLTVVIRFVRNDAAGTIPALMLRTSLDFLVVYVGLTLIVGSVAALARFVLQRRKDRQFLSAGKDPEIRSRRNLAQSVRALEAVSDDVAVRTMVAAIATAKWRHADNGYQQVSSDLAKAAATFAEAFDRATPARIPEVSLLTSDALGRIVQRLEELAQESALAGTQEARTMAGYIGSKYGGGEGL